MNKSIWNDYVTINKFNELNEDIETDVLVIGGGICGILCAYELKKRNIDVVVVEQDHIGMGITKNTTAFITAQHDTLYQDLLENHGYSKTKKYLELNLSAIEKYKELAKEYDIDFEECSSTFFTAISNDVMIEEKKVLDLLGYEAELIDELPINNIPIKRGIRFNNQGKLNPLKLIKELSKELVIYENTRIENIKGNKAYTKKNTINFKKVVITTHYPFINRYGLFFTKLSSRRSYVCALKHPTIEGTYCSIDEDGLYFRSFKDYLIIGGADRDMKNECTYSFRERIAQLFPNLDIEYSWSNQDLVTIDNIPYIGQFDIFHKNWYVATGFGLWGFTWSMVSSQIIADLIEKNEKVPLVNPMRCLIRKQLFINIGNVFKNMFTFRTPRCTHMGVALKYNRFDNTYECPAHGTRFDRHGNVINGPSKRDSHSKDIDNQK